MWYQIRGMFLIKLLALLKHWNASEYFLHFNKAIP